MYIRRPTRLCENGKTLLNITHYYLEPLDRLQLY